MTQKRFEQILSNFEIDSEYIDDRLDNRSIPWAEKKQDALQALQTVLLIRQEEIEQVIKELDRNLK